MSTAGKLTDALDAAGISPEKITKIIFTHAHPDHLWGTINDFDELNFPSAAYHIAEAEWNFWMAKDVLSKLPADRQGFAVGAQRHLEAAKAQLKTVKPGTELVAGINILSTPGHTPGHISLEVGTGNDAVVILGDALTHPVISFEHHDWQPATDQDPALAVATRKRLLDKLAGDKTRLIGYHLPMPGMGRVERKGNGFRFAALA
jgi:glyoxylase-like metal-dependent hydrolase (beta-lactamase superfamily II)